MHAHKLSSGGRGCRYFVPCPRCSSGHCRRGGKYFSCRFFDPASEAGPGDMMRRVARAEDCIPGENSYMLDGKDYIYALIFCDSVEEFSGADYDTVDYYADTLSCGPPFDIDCPQISSPPGNYPYSPLPYLTPFSQQYPGMCPQQLTLIHNSILPVDAVILSSGRPLIAPYSVHRVRQIPTMNSDPVPLLMY